MPFGLNQSGPIIGEQRENIKPAPPALAIDRAYRPRQSDKNNSMDTPNLGATLSPVLPVSTQPEPLTMDTFRHLSNVRAMFADALAARRAAQEFTPTTEMMRAYAAAVVHLRASGLSEAEAKDAIRAMAQLATEK